MRLWKKEGRLMAIGPWLITCVSGRSFIVYADNALRAREQFKSIIQDERVICVLRDIPQPTIEFTDLRKAPG